MTTTIDAPSKRTVGVKTGGTSSPKVKKKKRRVGEIDGVLPYTNGLLNGVPLPEEPSKRQRVTVPHDVLERHFDLFLNWVYEDPDIPEIVKKGMTGQTVFPYMLSVDMVPRVWKLGVDHMKVLEFQYEYTEKGNERKKVRVNESISSVIVCSKTSIGLSVATKTGSDRPKRLSLSGMGVLFMNPHILLLHAADRVDGRMFALVSITKDKVDRCATFENTSPIRVPTVLPLLRDGVNELLDRRDIDMASRLRFVGQKLRQNISKTLVMDKGLWVDSVGDSRVNIFEVRKYGKKITVNVYPEQKALGYANNLLMAGDGAVSLQGVPVYTDDMTMVVSNQATAASLVVLQRDDWGVPEW